MRTNLVLRLLPLLLAASLTILVGCDAGQVRKQLDAMQPKVEQAVEVVVSIEDAMQALVDKQSTAQQLIATLRLTLTPDLLETFDALLAQGLDAAEASQIVLSGATESATILIDRFDSLRAELADAEDEDDATFAVLKQVAIGVGSLFGVGGPLAFVLGRVQRQRGKIEGADATVRHINILRQHDTGLDAAFETINSDAKIRAGKDQPVFLADALKRYRG